ncbi:hypothetical protein QVD17_01955 [Tagetes erecta]|uniref:Uncharacterized protein n=1 Tax=Tagetes erecta TaxID=13708 RepID=A0AAD8L7B4_TARER|nr:hypothetical protein QVD17_01955 [Tagetes erecta]
MAWNCEKYYLYKGRVVNAMYGLSKIGLASWGFALTLISCSSHDAAFHSISVTVSGGSKTWVKMSNLI